MRIKFRILLLLLFVYPLIFCEKYLDLENELISKPDPDFPAIERVFHDIIETYFLEDKTPVDIVIIEPFPAEHLYILIQVLVKINGTLTYQIMKFSNFKEDIFLKNPAILLLSDEKSLIKVAEYFEIIRYQNQAFKYFIYFAHTTIEHLENFWVIEFHDKLKLALKSIIYHAYFIINELDIVSISTLDFFFEACNKQQLTRLHFFNKAKMKWIGNLMEYEKFLEFYGCELKMMLPVLPKVNLNSYHWGFSVLDANAPNGFSVQGITPKIFKIAGKKYNFIDAYSPAMVYQRDLILDFNLNKVMLVGINKTIKDPSVYFDITGVHLHNISKLRISNVFEDVKYNLLVTPGDLYTPYEKLFLPFDLTTWILLTATFGITFLTIFIINRLAKSARNFVYGSKICTPTLNVISIFFGISQARLPTENFSRFILILFVFFCLIFRTCFQSKSFEFLTSEPRRPPPKTLEDIVAQNYTISTLFKEAFENVIKDEREIWPQIKEPKFPEYIASYKTQSQNSSAKICLIIENLIRNELNAEGNPNWNTLELENIFVSHQAFFFQQQSYYFRMMFKTVNSLIDTGIMKHLSDDYLRKKEFIKLEEEAKKLSFNDLSFGFNIWLAFCCISFGAFLVELLNKPKEDASRLFKFAKPDSNFAAFECVLLDIIDVYFVNENTPFDIFVLEPFPLDHLDMLNAVLAGSNGKFSYYLLKYNNNYSKIYLENPVLFLVYDENSLEDIFIYFLALRYQNQVMKHFIYFAGTTIEKFGSFWLIQNLQSLSIMPGTIFYHTYFICDEAEVVSISTLEWFIKGCNKLEISRVHLFDKKSMTWIGKLQAYEKFLEFNGCELKMMVPVTRPAYLNSYYWGYAILDKNNPDGYTVFGITRIIFKIASKKFNFADVYVPILVYEKDWIKKFDHKVISGLVLNKTILDPNVYFDIAGLTLQNEYMHRMSNVFADVKYKLFVTPGDPYTPYEKLFLPFDLTTWILLLLTFGITFITIFIINHLPKSTRDFVYGSKSCTPSLNVISIFFGIAQAKLPTENFSRFILILFVFFCLIFRTCFQSESFGFLTSVPRRPPPRTLEDLVAQNYTIYTLFKKGIENIIVNEQEHWPRIVEPEFLDYIKYYKTQSQNSSAKMCLIIEDLLQSELDAEVNPMWNKIELENIYVAHQAFIFHQHSFSFRILFKTVNSLIDTGVIKHLTEDYLRQKKFLKIIESRKVLDLNDLSFGFIIWLGFCGISIAAFFFEFLKKPDRVKPPRLFKFAKVHPYLQNFPIKNAKKLKVLNQTFQNFKVKVREVSTESEKATNISIQHQVTQFSRQEVQSAANLHYSAFCLNYLDIEIDEFQILNPDFPAIIQVLKDVIDVYLVKEDDPFNIIIVEPFPMDQYEILYGILAENYEKFSYKLIKVKYQKHNHFEKPSLMTVPALFLVYNVDAILKIYELFDFIRYNNQPIKYFIYFAESSYEDIINNPLIGAHKELTVHPGTIYHHTYFILNEPEYISLSTIEWFVIGCNIGFLDRLNLFDKDLMTWRIKLKAYEKFLNYNGCELVLMLPLRKNVMVVDLNSYHWGELIIESEDSQSFTKGGIIPTLFNIAGKKFNFSDEYVALNVDHKDYILNINYSALNTARFINKSIKTPNVCFDVNGVQLSIHPGLKVSNVFADISYNLFVTPGDVYTPYEKLFLPFDFITWILIFFTFSTTFITILIINCLPEHARDFVYGIEINSPTLNVISIFFGISQIKLPTGHFPRFILMLFIFFCLIFRTCFQSKSFEFLTSEPRRSSPKSLEDLLARNYTISTLFKDSFEVLISDEKDKWPKLYEPNYIDYVTSYNTQSQNASAKMCLIIEELLQKELDEKSVNKWTQIDLKNIYVSHQVFIFLQQSFSFRMLYKTVNCLIDTGIMKYLTDNHLMRKKLTKIVEHAKVLSMKDLLFGFNIWLGFCVISFGAFMLEKLCCQKTKRSKFAKIHPMLNDFVEELECSTCYENFKIK
ncbi:unnamed protein product [Chironomus riparius]|uniref:Ionotropic receptor n=1 Tax=Chironomus riparius TaxID=315576 RepID=A0A9N9RX68_9DIPT|nr:unnamed protein product [Chironomus riparius]